MIEIRRIDAVHKADVRLPNEPFDLFGRMVLSYADGKWSWEVVRYAPEDIGGMCFPDENYDFEAMRDSVFLGAYDDDRCIGLAVLQPGFFRYMYLADLKVNAADRRRCVGRMLIEAAKAVAAEQGYRGIYAVGQDNNPGACLFYLRTGFRIGGLDTCVYCHTSQEGKSDIFFYTECQEC